MNAVTTIMIVDDHTLIRQTWAFLLNQHPQFKVISEVENGDDAIAIAKDCRPDVIIMDINMPKLNGIDATKEIVRKLPGTKILGVSLHTQPTYAKRMIRAGASGYVTKNSSKDEMYEAILVVAGGKKFICREMKDILAAQVLEGDPVGDLINTLSAREIEIISLVRKGMSSKEIAGHLFISTKTVEVHRYNILQKLGLKNTAALINFFSRHMTEDIL